MRKNLNRLITLEKFIKQFPSDFNFPELRIEQLSKKHWEMKSSDANIELEKLYNLTHQILQNIPEKEFHLQNENMPHPLSFELGHTTLFYENFINRFLNDKFPLNPNNLIFDSITNLPNERKNLKFPNLKYQKEYFNSIICQIIDSLPENKLLPLPSYLLKQSILHHHMHLEVYLFLLNQLKLSSNLGNPFVSHFINVPLTFVKINQDEFIQGKDKSSDFYWDNEVPSFPVKIKEFEVSKYPITYGQYLDFIENQGYLREEFWSIEGWRWRERNNITLPLNLIKYDNQYFRISFNNLMPLELDYPICFVSYYEAEAFAKFNSARLPTESEMEFLQNKYYNKNNKNIKINLNYQGDICSVLEDKTEPITGLMGNIWQWTKTPFHPYLGFKIDPSYERFSYPFFFFRNIVKGSSWCSPFNYPQYRNAQPKETRFQYIGIRLVRDI